MRKRLIASMILLFSPGSAPAGLHLILQDDYDDPAIPAKR